MNRKLHKQHACVNVAISYRENNQEMSRQKPILKTMRAKSQQTPAENVL